MDATVGWDINGMDAYLELKAKRRFPTKKHVTVKCTRYEKTVDVVFSRKGKPICLEFHDETKCDFCWAYNLHNKQDIPEYRKPQISKENSYWKDLRSKYNKA